MQPTFFHETVNGAVWREFSTLGLTLMPLQAPPETETLCAGDIILRYGVDILRSPHIFILGYLETENGAVKVGRGAWDFLWAKFQLYPRADVIGVRSDGQEAELLLKDLDMGEPPRVLVYRSENATTPIGVIHQLEAAPDAVLPPYLAQYAHLLKG